MDNVTHSLVGLAVGETAWQFSGQDETVRNRFWWISALANNLPDIDVLWRDTGAGYLLEHRGYTHTIAGWVPQALLLWLAFAAFYRRDRRGWGWMTGLAVLGIATHILLDAANSYGVHPFWPFTGQWYYGDTLFILEPWLWVSLAPPLFFASRGPIGRVLFASITLLALALIWGMGYVPPLAATIVTFWAIVAIAVGSRLAPRDRAVVSLAGFMTVLVIFASTARLARDLMVQAIPGTLDDVILTPMPSNPFCWSVITADHDASQYRLRRGIFAPFPALVSAKECPAFRRDGSVAPLAPITDLKDARFDWEGQYQAPLAPFRALAASDCTFRGLLHFARAPYLIDDKGQKIVADLRYDFSRRLSFAAYRLPASVGCPAQFPPWGEPRADWLE